MLIRCWRLRWVNCCVPLWVTCFRPFIIKLIIIFIGFQFVIRVCVLNRNWTSCDPPGEGTEFELKFNAQRLAESAADSQNTHSLRIQFIFIYIHSVDLSSDHMRTCNPAITLSLPFLSFYLSQSLSRRRHWHWRRSTPTPMAMPTIAIAITWCFNQFSANRCKQSKCKNYGNSGGIAYANSKMFLIDKRAGAGQVCRVRVIVNTVNTVNTV